MTSSHEQNKVKTLIYFIFLIVWSSAFTATTLHNKLIRLIF